MANVRLVNLAKQYQRGDELLGFLLTPLGVETRIHELRTPVFAGFFPSPIKGPARAPAQSFGGQVLNFSLPDLVPAI